METFNSFKSNVCWSYMLNFAYMTKRLNMSCMSDKTRYLNSLWWFLFFVYLIIESSIVIPCTYINKWKNELNMASVFTTGTVMRGVNDCSTMARFRSSLCIWVTHRDLCHFNINYNAFPSLHKPTVFNYKPLQLQERWHWITKIKWASNTTARLTLNWM